MLCDIPALVILLRGIKTVICYTVSKREITMNSNNDFHLHFRISSQNYDIDFISNENISEPLRGVSYSLQGGKESLEIVNKCFFNLASSLNQKDISETRKELRVKLWQAGATEISFSKAGHIGQEILGQRTPFDIQECVNKVCECLEKNYIFYDVAQKCSKYILRELQQGAYDAISDPETFAQAVTADLRLLSEDKHIEIRAKQSQNQIRPNTENDVINYLKGITYGLGTYDNLRQIGFIKEIPNDVGYLEVHGFQAVDENDSEYEKFPNAVEQTRAAFDRAMEEIRIKNPKLIIIDLRNNGGGSPYAVQLLSSYFLAEKTALNTIKWRKEDGIFIEEKNTLSYEKIPKEKRLIDTPLYILTSHKTFSAGEEFANNMKALNRATLIGEVTMGGANPGRSHQLNDFFEIFIPDGQSINPINGSNWEGIGVIPDLIVSADEALDLSLSL